MEIAAEEERKRRHDVMAHVHTFGLVRQYFCVCLRVCVLLIE